MTRINKIAIIVGVIIIAVIAFFVFRKVEVNKPYKILSPVMIAEDGVAFPTLSVNEQSILFFNTTKNKLQQISLANNQISDILDETIAGVYDVTWSPTKDQAIIGTSKQEGGDYTKTIYLLDMAAKTITPLASSKIESVAWSPDGSQIAYTFMVDENNVDISTAKPDGSGWKNVGQIKSLGAPISIMWAGNQIKVFKPFYNPPESYDLTDQEKQSVLYTINLSNNKTSPSNLGQTADLKYSPDGQFYVQSQEGDEGNSFSISSQSGNHPVEASLDSLSSTVWSKNSQNLYDIANNNNAATKKVLALYQIETSDFTVKKLVDFALPDLDEKSYFIDNLMVTENENYLFFTRQNTLYSYRIK